MTTKTAALWAFALGSITGRHQRCPAAADPAAAAHHRRDAGAGYGGRRMTGTREILHSRSRGR